ncbi:hypothetical protein F4780DRAFT_213395 [Xylariomycetidae sp. FL0641]|nr:hypothetical protein F4780DRAFT_213395 [Xylariomycetidae sp. FL0641]
MCLGAPRRRVHRRTGSSTWPGDGWRAGNWHWDAVRIGFRGRSRSRIRIAGAVAVAVTVRRVRASSGMRGQISSSSEARLAVTVIGSLGMRKRLGEKPPAAVEAGALTGLKRGGASAPFCATRLADGPGKQWRRGHGSRRGSDNAEKPWKPC